MGTEVAVARVNLMAPPDLYFGGLYVCLDKRLRKRYLFW